MRENKKKNIDLPPKSLGDLYFDQLWIAQDIDLDSIGDKYKGAEILINDLEDPYHNTNEFEVRYELRKLYYNKCAYCESRDYKPDVEHYRPKKSVTIQQRNSHGYYWLCFNWTNLLPACSACNSKSGKWSKFPISGTRITIPSFCENLNLVYNDCLLKSDYLNAEEPLLLNPELEAPEPYLELKWNGKFEGTDGKDGKGWKSIETYDLNRGNLISARAGHIDLCKDKIANNLILFRNNILDANGLKEAIKIQFNYIKDCSSPENIYSFVYFFIYENFTDFLKAKVDFTDTIEFDVVNKLFSDFKNEQA